MKIPRKWLVVLSVVVCFLCVATSASAVLVRAPNLRGVPFDAGLADKGGLSEQEMVRTAAGLTCRFLGYGYANSWDYVKGGQFAKRGTYRFQTANSIRPTFCSPNDCGWYFTALDCSGDGPGGTAPPPPRRRRRF